MVRAILEGRKSQTRRVMKPQPKHCADLPMAKDLTIGPCPYGQPDDRLWMKETFAWESATCPVFAADQTDLTTVERWTPSIFMPRKLSRITLEIVEVRVQRVQDISEKDAEAEGIQFIHKDWRKNPVGIYAVLWDAINDKRGYGWEKNPWVWAITFKRA